MQTTVQSGNFAKLLLNKTLLGALAISITVVGTGFVRVQATQSKSQQNQAAIQAQIREAKQISAQAKHEYDRIQNSIALRQALPAASAPQSAYLINQRIRKIGETQLIQRFERRCRGQVSVITPQSTDLDRYFDTQQTFSKAAKVYCNR